MLSTALSRNLREFWNDSVELFKESPGLTYALGIMTGLGIAMGMIGVIGYFTPGCPSIG